MATPKRKDIMIRNLMNQRRKNTNPTECKKQFPDCPAEKSKEGCGICPFYN
jgi:hypothetical protein